VIEEIIHQKLIKALAERLPDALAQAAETPFTYQRRAKDADYTEVSERHVLPTPQEIFSAEANRLYWPSVIVHYSGSTYTETECEQGAHGLQGEAAFDVDIALADGDEQLLTWLWHRYAQAVKGVLLQLSSADLWAAYDDQEYQPSIAIIGAVITNAATEEGRMYSRRGSVSILVRF
jgi:hypothetical protein